MLWLIGNAEGTYGVGVVPRHELAETFIEVTRFIDCLLGIKTVHSD